jgi:hypothetical protein
VSNGTHCSVNDSDERVSPLLFLHPYVAMKMSMSTSILSHLQYRLIRSLIPPFVPTFVVKHNIGEVSPHFNPHLLPHIHFHQIRHPYYYSANNTFNQTRLPFNHLRHLPSRIVPPTSSLPPTRFTLLTTFHPHRSYPRTLRP